MSSNHEGQPMTLLEAMALGRPIVATDIDGNRGVLKNEYGQLVENSEQGLIEGMELFLAGGVTGKDFDYEAYKTKALNSFATAVLN
jgi:CDP-glycerol glycerophosphotransferase